MEGRAPARPWLSPATDFAVLSASPSLRLNPSPSLSHSRWLELVGRSRSGRGAAGPNARAPTARRLTPEVRLQIPPPACGLASATGGRGRVLSVLHDDVAGRRGSRRQRRRGRGHRGGAGERPAGLTGAAALPGLPAGRNVPRNPGLRRRRVRRRRRRVRRKRGLAPGGFSFKIKGIWARAGIAFGSSAFPSIRRAGRSRPGRAVPRGSDTLRGNGSWSSRDFSGTPPVGC